MVEALLTVFVTGITGLALWYSYFILWIRPQRLRDKLRSQGIHGPPPSFLHGNIPEMRSILHEHKLKQAQAEGSVSLTADYSSSLFPYLSYWKKKYGPIFMFSTGSIQILHVTHPDLVKEIGLCKSMDLGKPSYLQKDRGALLGKGILTSNGALWSHQRKVIAPELFMDKVKGMVGLMVEAALLLSNSWGTLLEHSGDATEIVVDEELRRFSADVVSRACFGSSFADGKEIFSRLRKLQMVMSKSSMLIGIPGLSIVNRYLPLKRNREEWKLNREIRALISNIVKERMEHSSESPAKDLLQSIIEGGSAIMNSDLGSAETFIVDNCKNLYFAGHETVSVTATWCLMLLASHPQWQDSVRDEVLEVCQGRKIDFDMIRKLKVLTMVIQETLRLFPPSASVVRETLQSVKLGDIQLPKGITTSTTISMLHHDHDNWGADADEFNPSRFSRGIASACRLPHTYLPFGIGMRTCLGQNFAMVELKVLLSSLLPRFTFSLSPSYRHSPAFRLTIEPEFGVPLIVKQLR
ncbi:cytochrome P450 714C2-like isoform X1 [Zingiber officinale]|uniref:cytochrome P450 714C2-like isoform X1 n=1 Tax=Zingiber officinale TaxID=94328 RepID=UPI001C4AA473|nr:cytochrome P450 714C2-like isoform X1 [Zingiber officinale]XP_042381259.1 cytochrome P450 714C2-like isoform X1 [Zingiber officinale]